MWTKKYTAKFLVISLIYFHCEGKNLYFSEIIPFENIPNLKSFKAGYACTSERDCFRNRFIRRILSQNKEQKFPVDWFPPIQNLDTYLKPLYTNNNNCLLIINNFRSVDLAPPNYPWIVKSPKPAVHFTYKNNNYYYPQYDSEFIWVAKEVDHTEANYTDEYECPHSKMLSGLGYYEKLNSYCLLERFPDFQMQSKPWLCKVQIQLYHPELTKTFLDLIESREHPIPSSIPFITILVYLNEKPDSWSWYGLTWIGETLYQYIYINDLIIREMSDPMLTNEVLLTMEVNKTTSSFELVNILNLSKRIFVDFPAHQISPLSKDVWIDITIKDLLTLAAQGTNDLMNWYDYSVSAFRKNGDAIGRHMLLCENNLKSSKSLVITAYHDELERLFHAYAHELQTIMGNFSYRLKSGKICINGKIEALEFGKHFVPQRVFYPIRWVVTSFLGFSEKSQGYGLLHIETTMSDLRFVSCGQQDTEKFAFEELYNVYQPNCWGVFGIVIVVLVIALVFLSKRYDPPKRLWGRLSSSCLSILKVFLEQGDPFPGYVLSIHRKVRLIVAGLFLAAIVLSNAYKNNNVYNMIIQRKLVPFEHLNELVRDDFSIYTRSDQVYVYKFMTLEGIEEGRFTRDGHGLSTLGLRSEIMDLIVIFRQSDLTWTWSNLTTLSRLHPSSLKVYNTLYKEMIATQNATKTHEGTNERMFEMRREPEFQKEFWRREMQLLWNDLEKCNKTALILPEYLSNSLTKRLRASGKPTGNVGKEVYVNSRLNINLDGLYIPKVIFRAQGMLTSGILQWWNKFHLSKSGNWESNESLKAPNMNGNVLVLFILLLGGLMLSVLTFAIERLLKTICYFLVVFPYVIKSFYLSLKKINVKFRKRRQRKARRICVVSKRN